MNRVLDGLSEVADVRIAQIDGGSLRNAIPRESFAVIAYPESSESELQSKLDELGVEIKPEYNTTDPNLSISLESAQTPNKVAVATFQKSLTNAIYAVHSGIHRMSPDIDDLVQTSNNLARVEVANGSFQILCLTRSSVDSEKMEMARSVRSALAISGADVEFSGSYPGWTPDMTSPILATMRALYEEMYEEKPKVLACHAGLECGLLGDRYPGMEMISFGPNIRGAHSPDEKVQISSVQKFWGFLLETLKRTPKA